MEFQNFATAIASQFAHMAKGKLFRTDVDKDTLRQTYLASFPEGSNPIFRERTEHDCSCCLGFIRDVGNVVTFHKGKLISIWDVKLVGEPEYQAVADAMAALVKSKPVAEVFFHFQATTGKTHDFETLADGRRQRWNHFFANIPREFVKLGSDIPSALAIPRTNKQVFLRALTEITDDALETVAELIQTPQGLYKGPEYKGMVSEFIKLKAQFKKIGDETQRQIFLWENAVQPNLGAVMGIRNTSIGTLLVDLSEGMELEIAVKRFEDKVSGTNYKRPTALVTPKMIAAAKATLEAEGLVSALNRRHAVVRDLSVDDLLFVNKATAASVMGDVFDDIAASVPTKAKKFDNVQEISIGEFVAKVLPGAKSVEVLLENRHRNNLMTLVTAQDPTAGKLFSWDNQFSWSYVGNVADSIKERVKAAGGSIEGDVLCRLAWDYTDDLDFCMKEPNGFKVYFGNRRQQSGNGGMLDVDANGIDGVRPDPVENIFYQDKSKMANGTYVLSVNNYNRRSGGTGFEVEVEIEGTTTTMTYDKVIRSGQWVEVARLEVSGSGREKTVKIKSGLEGQTSSKPLFGLQSQTFVPARAITLSPNYWGSNARGNKHYFFLLEGAVYGEPARGFYNEMLAPELQVHRKVMEVVGSKVKVEEQQDQLSGLGFSETKPDSLTVKVTGATQRIFKVVI